MRRSVTILAVVTTILTSSLSMAAIKTQVVEYQQGDQTLQGYLAWDDAVSGKRPGVLVVHQWKGLTEYEKMRAEMLARLGYVALAVDIYGKGIRPQTNEEASAEAGKYYRNVSLLRERALAGLNRLKSHELVDPQKTASIGYCFGGKTVLELARSGADLQGVVSFHGNLTTPNPADAKNIKCKVLVCHGADDPYVPGKDVMAFYQEMSAANVDYVFIGYADAVHSFTHEDAGTDKSTGAAYNRNADRRSWEHMKMFFQEIFE